MSDIRMAPRVTPAATTTDSGYLAVQGFRDGSIGVVDFAQRMAAAGRVFRSMHGSVGTPLTFTNYTINRPQAWLRVPTGIAIMPIKASLQFATLTGTAGVAWLQQCANDIGNGTSTVATIGPISTRTDAPIGSNVTARHLATADTTVMTTPNELYRISLPFASTVNDLAQNPEYNPAVKPLIVGAGSLLWFVQMGTAMTGYAEFEWVETPSNWWT